MKILNLEIQISIKVSPKHFNDPEIEINKRLSSYLFKYSYKIQGIPLCYRIIGVYPFGNIICDNECIFLKTVVNFDILRFRVNDILVAEKGVVFGIVGVKVGSNEAYTGRFRVMNIDNCNGMCSVIEGIAVQD